MKTLLATLRCLVTKCSASPSKTMFFTSLPLHQGHALSLRPDSSLAPMSRQAEQWSQMGLQLQGSL